MSAKPTDCILIVDFGSQVTQLIARRVREAGVYCEIAPFNAADAAFERLKPQGHHPVRRPGLACTDDGSPRAPQRFFEAGVPMLGICYGQQTMAEQLGGKVVSARLRRRVRPRLHRGHRATARCSTACGTGRAPPGVDEPRRQGRRACPPASASSRRREGAPFARHRRRGAALLRRAVPSRGRPHARRRQADRQLRPPRLRAAPATGRWPSSAPPRSPRSARRSATGKVICGLSGGVDSAVAAVLIHEAIGDQLTCVFVDHGLMRLGEAEQVVGLFREHYDIPLVHVERRDAVPQRPRRASPTRRPSASSSARPSSTCSRRRRARSAAPSSSRRARSIPT